MFGLLFAVVALAAGAGLCRLLRVDLALAPCLGLAAVAIASTWCVALGLPPVLAVGIAGVLAAAGRPWAWRIDRAAWLPLAAAVVPTVLLGAAFMQLVTPISNHDGVFHVEAIDALRNGQNAASWYPMGLHASAAAMLQLAPWLDSARGVEEVTQGLSILAPIAVFGLALRLGANPLAAGIAALIQSVTFLFPYDFHLWGGWPLGLGVIFATGVWTVALAWLEKPSLGLAVAAGVLVGAIVLSHGTELYTSALGLALIAALRWRGLRLQPLVPHASAGVALAAVIALPYLPRLLGWASAGGATSAASESLETLVLDPALQGNGLWTQIGLGIFGASALVDLPLRVLLVVLGMRQPCAALARALWLTFVTVLVLFATLQLPLLERVYTATFPWLADQRLLQVATIFASVLAARGVMAVLDWLRSRSSSRRLVLAAVLVGGFFVYGDAISAFKRLQQAATEESAVTADDRAAMTWLQQRAQRGAMVANDGAADAGIWTPYLAGLPILSPRSGSTPPIVPATVCERGVQYLYYGARLYGYEQRQFDLAALQQSPALTEVFRSGDARVFQARCG